MPAKPLTIHQLMRKAGVWREENAAYVKLVRLKTGYAPDGHAFAACMSYSTHIVRPDGTRVVNHDRQRYITVIKFLDAQLHCLVSCSCPDFMYRAEYVLHQRGNAEIEYSNGEAPTTTNPANVLLVCKHVLKLYKEIKPRLVVKPKV